MNVDGSAFAAGVPTKVTTAAPTIALDSLDISLISVSPSLAGGRLLHTPQQPVTTGFCLKKGRCAGCGRDFGAGVVWWVGHQGFWFRGYRTPTFYFNV
jgi:hypothetical protein